MKLWELHEASDLGVLPEVIGQLRSRPFDPMAWALVGWHAARIDQRAAAYVIRDLNAALGGKLGGNEAAWLRQGFSGRRNGGLMPRSCTGLLTEQERERLLRQDYSY